MTIDLEFQEVVQRYAEGRISKDEFEGLCERLRSSPDARQDFVSLMNLEAALESIAAEWVAARAPLTPAPPIVPRRRVLIRKRYLATFAVCLAILGLHFWHERVQNQIHATVEDGTGVRELPDGTQLRNEWLDISGGTVKLITPNDARLVIEAPATFRFESPQRITLTRGRLAADIPHSARKFTVVTPSGEAVDLGTKFGVDVPLRSEAEIHVFQGEVIAQSSHGGTRRHLHTGEAFQLKSGAGAARKLRSAAFIRPEEVDSLHAALSAGQASRSEEALLNLRRDPSLITLLDFESPERPQGVYDTVQGRWPSSRSAEFVGAADHIRVDLETAGEWLNLTMAAWVRLNQVDNLPQSLLSGLSSKEADSMKLNWAISDQKAMQLAIGKSELAAQDLSSPSQSAPVGEQGRWVHLVAIYDGTNRQIRLLVNGKQVSVTKLNDARAVPLKRLEIGNAGGTDLKLSGRVDELVLIGRAMSDVEVSELFAAGNPYR